MSKKPKNPVKDDGKKDSDRVYRGGSWDLDARFARLSYRYDLDPGYRNYYLGFRIVKNIPKDQKEKK